MLKLEGILRGGSFAKNRDLKPVQLQGMVLALSETRNRKKHQGQFVYCV
jgi:hypothetical protein